MNIHHFYSIIEKPEYLSEVADLEKISQQYPYFSIAQMVYIAYYYKNNDDAFSNILKNYSHNITNRKYFFQSLKKIKHSPIQSRNTNTPSISFIPNISENIEKKNTHQEIENNSSQLKSVTNIDVQKEINKTIAESIVQKEILDIEPKIKEKAEEITSTTSVTQNIESNTEENFASNNSDNNNDNDTAEMLPFNSISQLLKQFSSCSTTTEQPTLSTSTNQNNTTENKQDKKEKIKQQQEIIDKILSNPPKSTKPIDTKFYSAENKAKESLLETEDLVTETLAQIYASQGNIHKAIRAYEILSLKFPQKNTYFAAKIQELKNRLKK
ncbi:MAG: hypothetical protein OHK0036_01250 [Bacteroidia bacterium]